MKGVLNETDYDEIAKRLKSDECPCHFTKQERISLHRVAEAWKDGSFLWRRVVMILFIAGVLGVIFIGATGGLPEFMLKGVAK